MLSRKPDKNVCFETSAFTPTTYLKARWRERKRSGGVVCLTWQLVSCQLLLLFWKPNWEVNFSVKSTKMLEHQSLILFSSLTKLRFLDIFNDVELFTKLGILAFFGHFGHFLLFEVLWMWPDGSLGHLSAHLRICNWIGSCSLGSYHDTKISKMPRKWKWYVMYISNAQWILLRICSKTENIFMYVFSY